MRPAILIALAAVTLAVLSSAAHAQRPPHPRLFVETPVAGSFTGDGIDGDSADEGGYILGWGFGSGWGLGISRISLQADPGVPFNAATDAKLDYRMVDFFIHFDGFGLHWQLGLGSGEVEVEEFQNPVGDSFDADTGDARRFYIGAGWPLFRDFALHVGYHSISAEFDNLRQNNFFDLGPFDVSASVLTLGGQLVF